MGENANRFVEDWVSEHVQPTGYEPEGDNAEARRLAKACWAAADQAGVSRASIQESYGDLVSYMAEQIERVNHAEVNRLASKDD